jgi:hypothetical protein
MSDEVLAEHAIQHQVTDQDSYTLAGSALTDVKHLLRLRTAERDAEISPLLIKIEEAKSRHKGWMEPLLLAEADLKKKMAAYADTAATNNVVVERAPGTSTRVTWRAEITDLRALVEAVASERVPLRYLTADKKELSQAARREKQDLDVPGVDAVASTSIAVTSHL